MLRTCDGTDEFLVRPVGELADGRVAWEPCACGLTFDDVDHYVTWPHDRLPTAEERLRQLAEAWSEVHGVPFEDAVAELRRLLVPGPDDPARSGPPLVFTDREDP